MRIWTNASVYEVRKAERLIRRAYSISEPTERTGDGDWIPYRALSCRVGQPAMILWNVTEGGVHEATCTSDVIGIDEDEP